MPHSVSRVTLLALALISVRLAAHPNYQATQRTSVELVPATTPPPGTARVSITIEGDKRVITANGLPDHATGKFPNAGNPNRIASQNYRYTIPLRPVENAQPTLLGAQPFGIAVNGVLFDPGTAEYWHDDRSSGWHFEAKGGAFSLGLDANNAHVQPNGAYHYHGIPTALLARLSGGQPAMTLLGWAADGFPIYGPWGHGGRARCREQAARPYLELSRETRRAAGDRVRARRHLRRNFRRGLRLRSRQR